MLQLRPYQEATVASAIEPKDQVWRRLLVLATGAGKTVIAAEILNRLLKSGQRALFVAHRDELLAQAKSEIEGFVPDLQVQIEKAQQKAPRSRPASGRHVVVGSILSMQARRLATWDRDAFDIVIIDEAHHGAATTYLNIVEHFGCMSDAMRTPLIGVTATPGRSDKVGLDIIFQEIAAEHNIRDLITQGYLCDIRAIAVESGTDIRGVEMRGGDFKARQLEDAVDNDKRNGLIVAAWQQHASGGGITPRPTIVFAAGVAHAKDLAAMFRDAAGVPAEAVWGEMPTEERRAALDRYARGETLVLTNYALLTEGFNAPQTSCIILARPTTSCLIVTQAIGRGTRLHPGKPDCLVIDVVDVTKGKDLFTAASLAGLPPEFDVDGEDVFSAGDEWEELKKLDPKLARRALDPATVRKWLEKLKEDLRTREINILNRPRVIPPDAAPKRNPVVVPEYVPGQPYKSPFAWKKAGDSYEISLFEGKYTYAIYPSLYEDVFHVSRFVKGDSASGEETVGIEFLCGEDRWVLNEMESAHYEDLFEAAHDADQSIVANHVNTRMIERNAPWRAAVATEKQVGFLQKLHIPVPEGLTKGEAGRLIDRAMRRIHGPKGQNRSPERRQYAHAT